VPFGPVLLVVGSGARAAYTHTKLRRLGGSVAYAASIPDAASLLASSNFDAIVLNAAVPQEGWETAQALRKISGSDAPVWIVTEREAGPQLRRQALANGVQFFRRHEGLHRLLETLIRRSLQPGPGPSRLPS
jgi:DNA-binding response OmpR family regulator